jgi:hypothetical protein
MKLTRSIMVVLVGLSLSAPAAHACEIPGAGFFTWFYHVCHPDSDQGNNNSRHDNKGSGRDCHGSSGGGSTTTTPPTPPSPKS